MVEIYAPPYPAATNAARRRQVACFASAARLASIVSAAMGVIVFTSSDANRSTTACDAAAKSPS